MPPKIASPSHGSGFEMLLKAVTLFLVGMAVLGFFGKFRMPRLPSIKRATRCEECGSVTPRAEDCPCKSRKA